jgi:hypothetical protein
MHTLTLLDKCSLEFASRNTSKIYPESLSEFGSAKLGCLPDAVANQGYADGYHYCLVTFERSTPFGQKQIPVTDELVLNNCFRYDKPTLDDGTSIWHIEMHRDASQNIDGFTVRVRPREWGVTGFRSYLVEMDFWPPAKAGESPSTIPKLTTHSTIENRDATGDDPVVWSWWHEPPVETRWTDNW